LFDYDKVCFKQCITKPDTKLSITEEKCLSILEKNLLNYYFYFFFIETCTEKLLAAFDHMHKSTQE
jgi:hypothetical protein